MDIESIKKIYGSNVKAINGPYKGKDDRYRVQINYEDKQAKTLSYPRVLVSVDIGRKLKNNEHVHHVDGDPTNNSLDNLEIINANKHASHHANKQEKDLTEIKCILCETKVVKATNHLKNNKNQNKVGPFCGKSCVGKYATMVQNNKSDIPESEYDQYDF